MNDKRIEIAFCEGFAYGERYGYEDELDSRMTPKEIGGSWFLSGCLFTRIHPTLARKPEQRSLWPEELEGKDEDNDA